jgi:PrtD family type I secretion system ABC transporter
MKLLLMFVPAALHKPLESCRHHLWMVVGFSALINILYLAPTIYMMQIYDRVVPTSGLITLFWLTVAVGVAIAVLTSLDALRTQLMIRASLRLDRMIAPALLEMAMLAREATPTAFAHTVMRQFDLLRQTFSGPAVLAMFDLPWTPLYVIVAFLIHPVLGGTVVLGGGVLVLLAWANQRNARRNADRVHDATLASNDSIEATLREAELVRVLGMRRAMVERHVVARRTGFAGMLDQQLSGSRYNSLVKFVRMFMQSVALGIGALLAVTGEISVGAIIAASVLLSRSLQPVEQLVSNWSSIVQAKQALRTVEAVIESAPDGPARRTTLPPPRGQVSVERLFVCAPDTRAPILKNVSFELQPGQVLGLVGPSGAGKTTLARVLAGALLPDAGEIRLDGANTADCDPDQLAPHIGYVPQSCGLLPGTVSENISRFAAISPANAPFIDSEVIRAAKLAGVHELILRLPLGYDTPIGGRRQQLSAGQTQRVALARALFGAPRLLILDEPNSALDSEGEDALNKAIAEAKAAGTTIVIVAHRTLALASSDLILVLQDGIVTQLGPKDEVFQELARRAQQSNVVKMPQRTER